MGAIADGVSELQAFLNAHPRRPYRQGAGSIPIKAIRAGLQPTRTESRPELLEELVASIKATGLIQPLIVRPVASGALWAQLQEVHAALEDFKTSGKPLIAYLEAGGSGEYYVATAADRRDFGLAEGGGAADGIGQARGREALRADAEQIREAKPRRDRAKGGQFANFSQRASCPEG